MGLVRGLGLELADVIKIGAARVSNLSAEQLPRQSPVTSCWFSKPRFV
jgi:hypothetical protein